MPPADEVRPLLGQFTAGLRGLLPLAALWAHGSLALGDFQPGRSDLDLVALIEAPPSPGQLDELRRFHEALPSRFPLADGLHCSYVVRADLADPARDHLTWAFGELFARVVSPVTRRELHQGGLCLFGAAPAAVLPAVSDRELADYVRAHLRDYWYPKTDMPDLWLEDVWVDVGLLTLARATVTLEDGRLITKREALDVLTRLGAPAALVDDLSQRRYRSPRPATDQWRAERARQAQAFLRAGIGDVLGPAVPPPVGGPTGRRGRRSAPPWRCA